VKPIIFSTDMVKAILEGRKTQTRRVVKPQPNIILELFNYMGNVFAMTNLLERKPKHAVLNGCIKFPYGQVGDKLWCRETHYRYGKWVKNGFTKTGKQKWTFRGQTKEVRYYDNPPKDVKPNRYREPAWYKRPSIFMPRWAFRITLEITEIRVERLQEITAEDCRREGVDGRGLLDPYVKNDFRILWDSINGKKHPWSSNPWVWAISFKMLKDKDEGRASRKGEDDGKYAGMAY